MMIGDKNTLDIYFGKEKIAELSLKNDQLFWEYSIKWQQYGFAVSPHLPLSNDISPTNTQIFLRNLLPEGTAFETIISYFNVSRSNTFALMRILGSDLSGALILVPSGSLFSNNPKFRIIQAKELQQRLEQRENYNLLIWDDKPRLSMAGVQDKLNVIVNNNGELGFGEEALCSTHILKFERHKLSHLVLNEFLTMRLAKECGLETAEVKILHFGKHPALLVTRFDRSIQANGMVLRRHVIDGCQALNLAPEYKYERNLGSGRDVAHVRDGASYVKLFDFAAQCINPAVTKQKLLDWALFNILIFNYDAHGKNISFFIGEAGISLAPFYDLVNVKMYDNFSQELAMALGDDFDGDDINIFQIIEFANDCNLSRILIADRLQNLARKLSSNLAYLMNTLDSSKAESEYLDRYCRLVSARCEFLLSKIRDIKTLKY